MVVLKICFSYISMVVLKIIMITGEADCCRFSVTKAGCMILHVTSTSMVAQSRKTMECFVAILRGNTKI